MSAIFVDQPYRLILDVGQTMVGATTKIAYQKPDGTTGEWDGTVDNVTDTTVYKDVSATENDASGWWHFQSYILFHGATAYARGKTVAKQIIAAFTYEMLNVLKSELGLKKSDASDDEILTYLLQAVVDQATEYCDVTTLDTSNLSIMRALVKQATYEWNRKRDLGISQVQYPDGSVTKFSVGEWLPEVKAIIDRQRTFTFGG